MQSDKREQTEGQKKRGNGETERKILTRGGLVWGRQGACDNPAKLICSNSEHFTRSDCYEGLHTK